MRRLFTWLIPTALICTQPALADPLSGQKAISLIDGDGNKLLIGNVSFEPREDTAAYQINLRAGPFADHFLSMRPFRCLEGADKHWCHVPYPYPLRREVSDDDLTDLEYDLLFIHKGATEYGIDMWNGVYYRLQRDGDRLIGQLHEMDMGILSAPPEDGDLRPVSEADIHEADPDSHWLPQVVID